MDNTEQRFEYERYGADWNESNLNIKRVNALRDSGYPITTQLCTTWNIQNIYYLDEVLTWANTCDFDSVHFNVMHDPWEFSLSCTPSSAIQDVILYLQTQEQMHPIYASDIQSLRAIVESSTQQDASALHNKLRKTDLYRNQNFAISHPKMAQAIQYEL